MAPREISAERFMQLVRAYLPAGNIVLGLAKESHIAGFENQPQFRTLQAAAMQPIIDKVNTSAAARKIYTLRYFQRETKYILEKLDFKKVLLMNGSWQFAFHTKEAYYVLANRRIDYEMLSPFVSEAAARDYGLQITQEIERTLPLASKRKTYSETEMMTFAKEAATLSFDYNFQTGAVLGRQRQGENQPAYSFLMRTFNKVVPFQTYAMHYGASREKNFSPPHDLNHYDTVHAEVELIINAAIEKLNLNGTSLFINLLPCPACARMFADTPIAEFVYSADHSEGYAVHLLEQAGKIVRRVVV